MAKQCGRVGRLVAGWWILMTLCLAIPLHKLAPDEINSAQFQNNSSFNHFEFLGFSAPDTISDYPLLPITGSFVEQLLI